MLYRRKFLHMAWVRTFISKVSSKFYYTLKSPNRGFFECRFWRYSEEKIFIKIIMMCNKRCSCSTRRSISKYWSFYFNKLTFIIKISECFYKFTSELKSFIALIIHNKIEISLTVNSLLIMHSMKLFRKRS